MYASISEFWSPPLLHHFSKIHSTSPSLCTHFGLFFEWPLTAPSRFSHSVLALSVGVATTMISYISLTAFTVFYHVLQVTIATEKYIHREVIGFEHCDRIFISEYISPGTLDKGKNVISNN